MLQGFPRATPQSVATGFHLNERVAAELVGLASSSPLGVASPQLR